MRTEFFEKVTMNEMNNMNLTSIISFTSCRKTAEMHCLLYFLIPFFPLIIKVSLLSEVFSVIGNCRPWLVFF